MEFFIDKQTQEDLNLFGKFRKNSIFSLFNQTKTKEGESLLEKMFQNPLTNTEEIENRNKIIQYFQNLNINFPISKELYEESVAYIDFLSHKTTLKTIFNTFGHKINARISMDKQFETLQSGILSFLKLLSVMSEFYQQLDKENFPDKKLLNILDKILNNKTLLNSTNKNEDFTTVTFTQTIKYNSLFGTYWKEITQMMEAICEIDVYTSAANVAKEKKMHYAKPLPKQKCYTNIKGLFHPGIKNPVSNPVTIDSSKNVLFLTGANMAGKSTFMKAYGIAVYLAHLGFPIPAEEMEFSILDGIFTSINTPDNIALGYSHFYAEVLRVKTVAQEISKSKNLLVIFDELFKGTNVKDAYDATIAITEAFGKKKNCTYIISTHIIEAGEELKKSDNIQFVYLPTLMNGSNPVYTYKLEEGISGDRHGMMIINNEHIIEIIKNESPYSNKEYKN